MRRESDTRAPAREPILGERARQNRDVDATCTPKCYKLRSIWFIYAYFKPKFELLREQSCEIIDKYIEFLFLKKQENQEMGQKTNQKRSLSKFRQQDFLVLR